MKIVVKCRGEVEEGFLMREPYVLISIRDPDKPKVKVKKSGLCRAILTLAFHDAEPTESLRLPPDIRLMTDKEAALIWQFVREHQGSVRAIVVHCEQGMSRSPAVAAGIAVGLGLDDRKFFARYQPNEYVRSLVVQHLSLESQCGQ
jgi:predicted protein tyrosine phosphatase